MNTIEQDLRRLNNIANMYFANFKNDKALTHYKKAIDIEKQLERKDRISITYDNMGAVYLDKGNYPKAIKYHELSLKYAKESGNNGHLIAPLSSLGIVYETLGEFDKAEDFRLTF